MKKLASYQAVLFDMDGTLYREDHVLPGVADLLKHLRDHRVVVRFVTNNSANTHAELIARLGRRGIDVPEEMIYTSCDAMVSWIVHRFGRDARVFNFAGQALAEDLHGRVSWVQKVGDPCDVVAVGTHFRENGVGFDMERAVIGLNLLRAGGELVLGSNDRCFPVAGGGVEFGSGGWGRLFAYAAGLREDHIHYVGKPDPAFFEPLVEVLGLEPGRCLLVGDNLESDILGGVNAGMDTALVLTGVAREHDAARLGIQPGGVFRDLVDMLNVLG